MDVPLALYLIKLRDGKAWLCGAGAGGRGSGGGGTAGAKGSMCRARAEDPGGERRGPASGHPKAEGRTAGFSQE